MNLTVLVVCVIIVYVHSTPLGYYTNCHGNIQFKPQDYHPESPQHKPVDKKQEESVSKNIEFNSVELTTHKSNSEYFLAKVSTYKSILDIALTKPVKLLFNLKKSDQDPLSIKSSTNNLKNDNIDPELPKSTTNKTIKSSSETQTYIPNKDGISTPQFALISAKTESSTHKSISGVISTESSIPKSSSTIATTKSLNLPTQKSNSTGTTFGSQHLLDIKENEESCGVNQMRDFNGVCRDEA